MPDFVTDDQGRLVYHAPPQKPEDPMHSGQPDFTIKWDRMMERNGMATHIAGILSFAAHERLRFFLEEARTEELADPRFEPITWDQILRAEQEVWRQLSDQLQEKVRGRPGEKPPADALLDNIL